MKQKYLFKILYSYPGLFIVLSVFILLLLFVLNSVTGMLVLIIPNTKSYFVEGLSINWIILINCIYLSIVTVISTILFFIFYLLMSSIITHLTYQIAADKYLFKPPKLADIAYKSLDWGFYRFFYILSPLKAFIAIIAVFVLLSLLLFNYLLIFMSFSFPLFSFISVFIFLSLFVWFIVVLGMVLNRIFMSMFGMVCAVSEPNLENYVINKRSSRLLLSNISNIKLFFAYLIFPVILLIQLADYIISVYSGNILNINLLLFLLAIDITYYLGLSFLKSSLYVDSIVKKYEKITFRDKLYLRKIISDL